MRLRLGLAVAACAGALNATSVPAQEPVRAAPAVAAQAPAARPSRVALVIGNSAYAGAPLPNPVNDARDMAQLLERSGFAVIKRENATLAEMNLALREFGDRLTRQSVGLFYYAGHGVQVRGRNYLIPVNADIAREDEVHYNALDLAAVLDKMDTARNPTNLVILDACRNNPFAGRFSVAAPGLAQIDAPPGSFIAFATAPGKVAIDGKGRNGLYTKFLLQNLARPGARIEDAFKEVRRGVRQESKGIQVPWESTSLEGDFYFREEAAAKPPPQRNARNSKGAPGVRAPAPGSAPRFAPGDSWTFATANELTRGTSTRTVRVVRVDGDGVAVDGGKAGSGVTLLDPIGNIVRRQRGDATEHYVPSLAFYQFPMAQGSNWTVRHRKEVDGVHVVDSETQLRVVGEEEVETPAGRFATMKVERIEKWKNLKTGATGTATTVYWYSARAKRYVRLEWSNRTADGRLLIRERTELVSYRVK